jgi:hypothetical protein
MRGATIACGGGGENQFRLYIYNNPFPADSLQDYSAGSSKKSVRQEQTFTFENAVQISHVFYPQALKLCNYRSNFFFQ